MFIGIRIVMNESCCKVFNACCLLVSHLRSCVLHHVSISTRAIMPATYAFIGCQGNIDSGAVVVLIVITCVTSYVYFFCKNAPLKRISSCFTVHEAPHYAGGKCNEL